MNRHTSIASATTTSHQARRRRHRRATPAPSPAATRAALLAAAAALTLAAAAPHIARAADGTWTSPATGPWSATTNWAGGTAADGAGATANFSTIDPTADVTVHLDAPHTLGNLSFGDTDITTPAGWTVDNNGTAANTLTLSTGTTAAPTINVDSLDPAKSANISAALAGTSGFIKNGTGTLVLSGANTLTGAASATTLTPIITINAGTVALNGTTQAALSGNAGGTGSVVVDGGTLSYIGSSGSTAPNFTHVITIGPSGGTLNSLNNAGSGKWVLASGGRLDGSGTLTKTGVGWLTINAAAPTFTGDTHVKEGVLEAGSTTALGSGKVYVEAGVDNATAAGGFTGGGFLSLNLGAGSFNNEIHVDHGTIGVDTASASVFGGSINIDGPAKFELGNFWNAAGQNLTLSGSSILQGSGNITLIGAGNPGAATNTTGQTLNINGDASAYAGKINVGPSFNVNFGGSNFAPDNVLVVSSSATALGGVGLGLDPNTGPSPANQFVPLITDNTTDPNSSARYGGVFGINTNSWTNTPIDLSTLYSGTWSLGSQGAGTYSAPTLGAAADHVYRLGGGGGTLTIATPNVVTGANSVNIGSPNVNGGGTVRFGTPQNYTGATNIIQGTLSIGANNAIPTSTAVTFGGVNGTTKYAGTLDVNGFSQTLSTLSTAAGADPAAQTITNNGAAVGTLTLDTSAASGVQTFAGPVKDGNKPLALAVTGSNAANGLVLPNAATSITGGVSVNRVTLTVGPASGAPNAAKVGGPVSLTNGGTLALNSTANMTLGVLSGNGNLIHSGTGNLTLGANNSAFSGSITVNGGGTLTAGLSTPGVNPLSSAPITLAGGKLAVQGQMTSTGVTGSLAPVTTFTGWNADTIYAATDSAFYPNNKDKASATGNATTDANNSLADQFYSYYVSGFTPNSTQAGNGQLNKGTTLTSGLPGQSFTSAVPNTVTGTNTPFQFQSLTANQTLQIAGGTNGFHQGTLTLSTPSGFKNLAILASNGFGTDDALGVTINFTDGTSVTTSYHSYDWFVGAGTDAAQVAANVFNGTTLNRYSPYQAVAAGNGVGGWDQRSFGIFESDIDLTNINGVDYSNKVVTSVTFDSDPVTGTLPGNRRTNIYAVSGQAIPLMSNPTQSFSNNIAVTADSGIDVTGSLNASFGTLNLGAKLSATSADSTTNPYSLTFGPTTLTGNAAVDVAKSTGGGPGTVTLGAISGSGSLAKSGAGTLKLAAGGNISGTLSLNSGTLEIDANTTAGALAGAGGALNLASGNLTVGPSTGTATRLTGLTIAPSSRLDLNNNNLALSYGTNPSPADSVRQLLRSGRNDGTAAWNGPGIDSTAARLNPDHTTAYGYAEASAVLGLSGSATASWNGATVDASTLLVKYTYYGDLNLDGQVNADDYALIDRGLAKGLTGWSNGDVNYDNVVNSADYLLMDTAFGKQSGGVLSPDFLAQRQAEFGDAYVSALVAAVPEPTSLAACGLAVSLLLPRRRRPTK